MLPGKIVNLVGIEKEDLPKLIKWRNNPNIRKNFREYREITLANQEKWYDSIIQDRNTEMFIIEDRSCTLKIGCCGLRLIDWKNRNAEISLYISDVYIDDKGKAEDALKVLLDYAKNELGLHRIYTEIFDTDNLKKELLLATQFKIEGTLKDRYFYDGTWHDSYMMAIIF